MFCALTHTSSIPMSAINFYMQERFLHSLIPLLFPWVQCQSLKPVLGQCSQTVFVKVNDFIALYTHSFFTLTDKIAPLFTVLTKVWPHANRAVVTNNSTVITEAVLIEGFW